MSLDEAIERSYALLDEVIADIEISGKQIVAICTLYSGGNDSTVLTHLMRERATHAVHCNTTIGIEATRQFVRDTCKTYGIPLIERMPPEGEHYADLVLGRVRAKTGENKGKVVFKGFPGPAQHRIMFTRLKERTLEAVRRDFIPTPKDSRRKRVIFLAGMRLTESNRRWRNTNLVDYEGATVWVSPIAHWSTRVMTEYRARFDVPRNWVSDTLHMSGECLCGSFAKPDEFEELAYWFPDDPAIALIRDLQEAVNHLGYCAAKWGERPPKGCEDNIDPFNFDPDTMLPGRLCSSCTTRVTGIEQGPTVEEMVANPAVTRAPRRVVRRA